MLDVKLIIDNMAISNIEEQDMPWVLKFLKSEYKSTRKKLEEEIELNYLREKFLEYYLSENEFFLKVTYKENDNFLGIIKGRVEFKNPHEAWIWSMSLNESMVTNEIGSVILKGFNKYLKEEYGVRYFCTRILKENNQELNFWIENGYEIIRFSKGFYNMNEKSTNMIILGKYMGRINGGQIYAVEK